MALLLLSFHILFGAAGGIANIVLSPVQIFGFIFEISGHNANPFLGEKLCGRFLGYFRRFTFQCGGDGTGVGADLGFDFSSDLGIVLEELLGILPALADALATVGKP